MNALLKQPAARAAGSLSLLALCCAAAYAQQAPDAGSLLRDATPLPAPAPRRDDVLPDQIAAPPAGAEPSDIRFAVDAFVIEGANALPAEQLQPLLDDLRGPGRSLATLDQAAARITRSYREHGYLLARAYVPQQRLDQGLVRLRVLEGTLGEVRLENASAIGDALLDKRLARLGLGQPLLAPRLERELLLLSDLPGVTVRSSLTPGATVGATDLNVAVDAGPRAEGEVGLDNTGNRFTGQLHANAQLALNNPLGIGDLLQVNGITSRSGFDYGRIAYQLPLGVDGSRIGVSYGAMHYRLGDDFAPLDASGSARLASVFASRPLVRSRRFNLALQVRYDGKRLHDRIGVTGSDSDKRVDALSIGLAADSSDGLGGGGRNQGSLSATLGRLRLPAANLADDDAGHRSNGRFAQANLQAARLQSLGGPWELLVQLAGQYASGNLDSAQKMSLGGPYAVRAYPAGEAAADDALLGNLELRRELGRQWLLKAFVDYGRARLNHAAIAADGNNLRSLSGVGLAAGWSNAAGYRLQATLAWRTGAAASSDRDRSPRLWMQLARSF